MNIRIKQILKYPLDIIKSLFLNGLLTILPITLTVGLFAFSFKLVKSWLTPIYELEPTFLKSIPHSEIVLVILLIFLIGAVLKFLLLHQFVHAIEAILNKIPLLRQVYFGIKQILHAFTAQDKLSFQRVVLVEFPRNGMYSIGFLTSQVPPELLPKTTMRYFSVFIPTTPNPTTGYFVCVAESEFTEVDLTRQEAMALIISGGIIQPERYLRR